MNTGKWTKPFRSLGLILLTDQVKFFYQRLKFYSRNKAFKKEQPTVALPPAYMLFEAFQFNYRAYYEGGLRSAKGLVERISKHQNLEGKRILDWGCGPARIVRHMPDILGAGCEIHGTDYNPATVAWCKAHIPGVKFAENAVDPPTSYPDAHFDAIYGISIFTHLSEKNHKGWYEELMRIARPGGILLLTTHGNIYRQVLTDTEKEAFDQGQLIIRGQVTEGHRVFAAFHPPAYMQRLFETKGEVLEHIAGTKKSWGLDQDVWIIRKK